MRPGFVEKTWVGPAKPGLELSSGRGGVAAMANARLLIVEDEAVVAMDIQSKLESIGYSVELYSYFGCVVIAGRWKIPETYS